MGNDGGLVRVARADEVAEATRPLARSHFEDPGMVAFFPTQSIRPRALAAVMGLTVKDAIGFGHVYVAPSSGRTAGTAVWLPPGAFPPGLRRGLAGVPLLFEVLRLSPRTFGAFMRFGMTAARHAKGEEVWFLAALGVDPRAQGLGLGSRLLRPVLTLADARGEPCMLNTQNEANLEYYRQFGFEVAVGPWRAGSGPTSWTMRRDPGSAAA